MMPTIEHKTMYVTFYNDDPNATSAAAAEIWDELRAAKADFDTLTFQPAPEEHIKRSANVTALVYEYDKGTQEWHSFADDHTNINTVITLLSAARDEYRA